MGYSGSGRWGYSRGNTGTKNSHQWVRDQLTDVQKQVMLKCDWNSTQFCVTSVHFNNNAYN